MIWSLLFFTGCSVVISDIDQPTTVTRNEHVTLTVENNMRGPTGGVTHFGYFALLVPTDWSVSSTQYHDVELTQDDPLPADPTVAPTGYKWSVWRTVGSYTSDDDRPVVAQVTVGTTTGSFSLEYYVGMNNCDEMEADCDGATWNDHVSRDVTVTSGFSGAGSGTMDAPYEITSCGQLQLMNNDLTAYYQLQNDIDCSATSEWNDGAGFLPIGNALESQSFTGFFDGNHHTISHLMVNASESRLFVGLFESVQYGTIENLTLSDGTIIQNATTTPYLGAVGGLAGVSAQATMRGIHVVNMNISGHFPAGGIVGIVANTEFSRPDPIYSTNDISFSSSENNLITAVGENSTVGGIVGSLLTGNIDNVFSSSTVSGELGAGGIAGVMGYGGEMRNAYAMGSVSSSVLYSTVSPYITYGLGGLVGVDSATLIRSSFSVATVTLTGVGTLPGAIVGRAAANITNTYFDSTVVGYSSCLGVDMGGSDAVGCVEVNNDGTDSAHFKNTNEIEPFIGGSIWDFDLVWQKTDNYPTLRTFIAPPHTPANLVVTGDDYSAPAVVTWSAPSSTSEGTITGYQVEYKFHDDDGGWMVLATTTASELSLTISVASLATSTHYDVRVRAFQDGPEGRLLYGLPTTPREFETGVPVIIEDTPPPPAPPINSGGGGLSAGSSSGGLSLPVTFSFIPLPAKSTASRTVNHSPSSPAVLVSSSVLAPVKPSVPNTVFTRPLKIGSQGADVKALQQFLNRHGFPVARSGIGSLGRETTVFGAATAKALIKFQEAHANMILKPSGLKKGTGMLGPATMNFIKTLS